MTSRLGWALWATGALVVLAAVSACGGSGADSPGDPTHSASSPTIGASSAAPSSSPRSESEVASASAEDVVRRYFAVLDDLRQHPSKPAKGLSAVATSAQLNAVENLLQTQRGGDQRQVGTTAISELKVQSVSLDNSGQKSGKVPTVVIDVCWDVSKVDVLDTSGKSIVSPNRPDTGWTRFTVANYEYAADPTGGWRVATGHDLEQAPCAAS